MPRRNRKRKPRHTKARRKTHGRAAKPIPVRRKRKSRTTPVQPRYRALVAILMFLYMLKLIDESTLNRVYASLSPKRSKRRRKRRAR